MADPRKLFEARDMEGAILYAKRVTGDNEAWPLLAKADGSLLVNVTGGTITIDSTGLAKSELDNSAFSATKTYGTAIMGIRQDTNDTLFDGFMGVIRMNLNRAAHFLIRDSAGNDRGANVDASGNLQVVLSTTSATINNAVGNPVNVSVTNTVVTIGGGSVSSTVSSTSITASTTVTGTVTTNVVAGNINISSATLGTVTITGTVTPSTTASTITNAVGNPVNVALTLTEVTVKSAVAGFNVNVATATLGTVTITGTVTLSSTAGTVTNSVSTIAIVGRTLTGSTGSLSATNGAITLTPTNRIKIYAISLTTTSATELICILNSGGVANGLELWRATLMAPAGASAGLNLAVAPPNFLFASRSGTAVSLSLNTATLIHYSVSYFDEV